MSALVWSVAGNRVPVEIPYHGGDAAGFGCDTRTCIGCLVPNDDTVRVEPDGGASVLMVCDEHCGTAKTFTWSITDTEHTAMFGGAA